MFSKGKSAKSPLFNGPDMSSTSNKSKLFAKDFARKSNLDDSGISLHFFLTRTDLKLHNKSVTQQLVKKVIINLGLSKASGPNCIPKVVLKNYEPELSYILAELWKNLPFQIVKRFFFLVTLFRVEFYYL